MKNLLISISFRLHHVYHKLCVYLYPEWKLRELLRVTPYMDVRVKIWEKFGNICGKDAFINSYVNLVGTSELEHNVILGDRSTFSPNVTFVTAAGPNNSDIKKYDCCQRFIKVGSIYVGEDSWIGAGVIILPGVHIGKRCVIGAGSVVTKDVPDDSLAYGIPCRVVRKLDYGD